jgi:hypothetical protein
VRPRTNDWLCPPLALVAPAGRPTDLRLTSLTWHSPDGAQYVKSQQDNAPQGALSRLRKQIPPMASSVY